MSDNPPNRRIDDKRDTRPLEWVDQPDALHPGYQKALRTRDELEDHIARCGAQLLDMLGVGGFLAPITGTNPVQYVAAGTLDMIGNVMQYAPGSPVSTAVGELVAWMQDDRMLCTTAESKKKMEAAGFGKWAEIAKRYTIPLYLAAPTQVSAPQAIVVDWPPCNPACDPELQIGLEDCRNEKCSCEPAKASVARQQIAGMAVTQASAAQEVRAVPEGECEHCGSQRPLHLLTCPIAVKGMAEGKKKEAPEPLRQLLIDLSNNTYFCGLHLDDDQKYAGYLAEAEKAEQSIIELFQSTSTAPAAMDEVRQGCKECIGTYCLLGEKCRDCGHEAEHQGIKPAASQPSLDEVTRAGKGGAA